MFNRPVEIDTTILSTYIEKPSHECTAADDALGIQQVIFFLDNNPEALMNVLSSHPYIAVSYLLEDLAKKMKQLQCDGKLVRLADKCLAQLVESCSYNLYDLERCVKVIPVARDKVLNAVVGNDDYVRRLLTNGHDANISLQKIGEKFPDFAAQFAAAYRRIFIDTSPKAGTRASAS